MHRSTFTFLASAALLAACGGPADGTIAASVYGETFIEEGIPAADFSDGWAVSFDQFLVSIGGLTAQAGHDDELVGDPAFRVVDLAQPSGGDGFPLTSFGAPGGTYEHYRYQIGTDAGATAVNVTPADLAAMQAAGASVWVRGSAVKGAATRTFDWAFTFGLTFGHCELGELDGGTLAARATIHADHLFYDDAVSDEPARAFQLLADADGAGGAAADGDLTLEELAAVDIRGQARYQVGSLRDPAGQPIVNLRQYVEHQVTTVGHINGEGHCGEQFATP